ncbi:MAG: SEL1-like repeat protein [Terriglobales bacterium]
MSALPQHDERVTCLSCRFSYPGVRGFCPMCGTPTPAIEGAAPLPGPRPVAGKAIGKAEAIPGRGPQSLANHLMRRLLLVAAALLAIAGGLLVLRARNATTPDIITPAPAIAATPPDTPAGTAAPEEVAEPHQQMVQEPVVPAPHGVLSAPATTDPAELWKRVRKGNTDAEVTLAKLYLDGNGVAQNCEQARLLLLAASRRQNRAADQVLTNLYPHRCP